MLKLDLGFIIHFKCRSQRQATMLDQKGRNKESRIRKAEADRRVEEIRVRIEKLLERTRKIEFDLARKEKELEG